MSIHPSIKEPFTRKTIRAALKAWQRTEQLGRHPLAQLTIVQQQTAAPDKPTLLTQGLALRQVLRQALEKLKPASGERDDGAQRWRPYLILTDQFVHHHTPDEIINKLGIARSTFNHSQAAALDLLGAVLQEWEQATQPADRPPAAVKQRRAAFLAPPRPPHALIGRKALLRQIRRMLLNDRAVPSIALVGLPGVGKTALAINIAHDEEILRHFGDGILWARLGQTADAPTILATWANALGVSSSDVAKATHLPQLVELVHAAIGLRRMLLIADDAWDEETALVFRIGGPYCAHLLTTRLPNVAVPFAGEGMVTIPELKTKDSIRLLNQLAPVVTQTFPDAAARLAGIVGGLPLALVLIGNYLQIQAYTGEPEQWQTILTRLVTDARLRSQLEQTQAPLTRHPSLPSTAKLSLAAVIELSQSVLNEEMRHILQALTVFPSKPNTFSATAAAAVSDQPLEIIAQLVGHGLLEQHGDDRYTLHQVIADHARPTSLDKPIYQRQVAYFVAYVQAHEHDFDLLEPELNNILAAIRMAESVEMTEAYITLINALYNFLNVRGLYEMAKPLLFRALTMARSVDNTVGTIETLANLGRLALNQGEYETAESMLREGLAVAIAADSPGDIGRLQQVLGVSYDHRGQYQQALRLYEAALNNIRVAGDKKRASTILMNLGGLNCDLGNYEQAEAYLLEGLQIAREIDHTEILSPLLLNLGAVAGSQGDLAQEEVYYQEALIVARGMAHREDISFLLTNLGALASDQGKFDQAEAYLSEGLAIVREIGHQERISSLLRHLGTLEIRRYRYAEATVYITEGLELARKIGHQRNICALLLVRGIIYQAEKQKDQALACFQESLLLAQGLGHQWFVAETLTRLGEFYLEQQDLPAAGEALTQALAIAEELKSKGLESEAVYGLAQLAAQNGALAAARQLGQRSLALYRALNDYHVGQVEGWLAGL